MSSDLEKVIDICLKWEAAGGGNDCFWEPWVGQPSEDGLTPNMVLSVVEDLQYRVHGTIERIEYLVAVNDELEAKHKELVNALSELLDGYVDDLISSDIGDDEGYEIWKSAKEFRRVVSLAELKG